MIERCEPESGTSGIRKTMYAEIRHFNTGAISRHVAKTRAVRSRKSGFACSISPNSWAEGASPAGLGAIELTFVDAVTSRDYREVTREPFTEEASASILLIEGSSGGGLPGACDLRVGRRFFF